MIREKWTRWRRKPRKWPHRRNIDLIEHLNDRQCLVEINIVGAPYTGRVQVMLTDRAHKDHQVQLTVHEAWVIGEIIHQFDRRGLREFGYALKEGAELISRGDT
jgi:hypothetical protein